MTLIERIGAWFLQGALIGGLVCLLVIGCTPDIQEAEELPEAVTDNYVYDVPLEPELQLYINNLCEDYGVDPALILAMIKVESSYNAEAVGDGGDSIGLMQIQGKWWSERMAALGITDLTNPYENVTLGIDIIASHLASGQGVEFALMAYNGGVYYASEMTLLGEVSDYANKVMAEAYRLNYERIEHEGLDW